MNRITEIEKEMARLDKKCRRALIAVFVLAAIAVLSFAWAVVLIIR